MSAFQILLLLVLCAIYILTDGLNHGNKKAKSMTQIPRPRSRDLNQGSDSTPKKKDLRKIESSSSEKYSQAKTSYYTDTSSSIDEAAYYDDYNYDNVTTVKFKRKPTKPTTKAGTQTGQTGPNQPPMLENILTEQAWAEMPNSAALKKENLTIQQRYEEDLWHVTNLKWDYHIWSVFDLLWSSETYYLHHICYQIASTYLHARAELHDYYRLRYAYNDKKEFEIGYVVHEIVYKYTTMLEIFHNIQSRFYNESRFSTKAPISYMLYMYGVTLTISQTIIHLCNILHEIENKYQYIEDDDDLDGDPEKDKRLAKGAKGGGSFNSEAMNNYLAAQQMQKDKMREMQKKLRKEKKAMLASGIFSSTTRTRRPFKNKAFPYHYGWSIENW